MAYDESGSAHGDVVAVSVGTNRPRPYSITIAGHRFGYEVAIGGEPPEVLDLRLVAREKGTAVARADVVRAANSLSRLALIAAKRRDELDFNRQTEAELRSAAKEHLAQFGLELGEDDYSITSWSDGDGIEVIPRKRGRGRPARPKSFYGRVARAAMDAEADPDRRSIAKGVQMRAASWPDVDGEPPLSTVERWLKAARKYGLYQGPRAATQTEGEKLE